MHANHNLNTKGNAHDLTLDVIDAITNVVNNLTDEITYNPTMKETTMNVVLFIGLSMCYLIRLCFSILLFISINIVTS